MSDDRWIWQCNRMIPSDAVAGRRVLDTVLRQLESHNWDRRDVFGVHLAMEEALVNAIIHGNHLDPGKKVTVRCRIAPDLVRIEITDQGEGFSSGKVPDPTSPNRLGSPSGRGVMLMKAFMSRVQFNATGNSVTLEKDRRTSP
ncbi:MAG: ATP-binding protein [Pirellulales bacterium]|nr:ATP-binding protein [Pirellulales bacterium]